MLLMMASFFSWRYIESGDPAMYVTFVGMPSDNSPD
jgi:hypothetical protein